MPDSVKKANVRKTDVVPIGPQRVTAAISEVHPPLKRSAYERVRVALKLFGLGSFEFEREHDDRG
jgi:hypothetical protein